MTTVQYQFSDGHFEDVECTEEFKREYEFLLVREKAPYWKEMKQKKRAGLKCAQDFSLDKFGDDGYDIPSATPDLLEEIIREEERQEYYKQLLSPLTDKQREVYILKLKGYKQEQIARNLNIAVSSVNERLQTAQKRILENILQNPKK